MSRDWCGYEGPFHLVEHQQFHGAWSNYDVEDNGGRRYRMFDGDRYPKQYAELECSCLNESWYADHPAKEAKDE